MDGCFRILPTLIFMIRHESNLFSSGGICGFTFLAEVGDHSLLDFGIQYRERGYCSLPSPNNHDCELQLMLFFMMWLCKHAIIFYGVVVLVYFEL